MSPVPLCTWGGGSPPAAVGHSGSILRAPGPLHWQGGDGSARVQFPRRRTSSRAGEAGGCLKPSGWDAGGHGPVPPAASFMQAVPKPGSARRAANNRDVSASPGASLLKKVN